ERGVDVAGDDARGDVLAGRVDDEGARGGKPLAHGGDLAGAHEQVGVLDASLRSGRPYRGVMNQHGLGLIGRPGAPRLRVARDLRRHDACRVRGGLGRALASPALAALVLLRSAPGLDRAARAAGHGRPARHPIALLVEYERASAAEPWVLEREADAAGLEAHGRRLQRVTRGGEAYRRVLLGAHDESTLHTGGARADHGEVPLAVGLGVAQVGLDALAV